MTVNQKNKMKKLLLLLAISASALVGNAQTNPQQTFFKSFVEYFTQFDTNSTTFKTDRVDVYTGVVQDSAVTADSLIVDLNFSKGGGFYGEGEVRNATIAGVIVEANVGGGYSIVHYDAKFSLGVNGGYDFRQGDPVIIFYADIKKALTENTFAGLRLGYESNFREAVPKAPTLWITGGFKF